MQRQSLDNIISNYFDEIYCPCCGACSTDQDTVFSIILSGDISITARKSNIAKRGRQWVCNSIHWDDMMGKSVLCHKCKKLSSIDICKSPANAAIRVRALSLTGKWATLEYEDKKFYVLTDCVRRSVIVGDICYITGIHVNEIGVNKVFQDTDIVVKRLNDEND